MLQIIGALLSGLGVIAYGYRMAGRQEERIRAYWQLRQDLAFLSGSIERGEALPEALKHCGGRPWRAMAGEVAKREERLETIWEQALEKAQNPWGLYREEETQLLALGGVLGTQDRRGCAQAVEAVDHMIAAQEAERIRRFEALKLLYRQLGWLGGIMVSIILL